MSSNPYTFFGYPFNHYTSLEAAIALVKHVPRTSHIVLIRDSNKPLDKELKKVLTQRLGSMMAIRPSGPWNKLWREVAGIQIAVDQGDELFSPADGVWFLSELSPEVIFQAMKRHRTAHYISTREQYWLDTIHLGAEFDDVVAHGLENPYYGPTDRAYKTLSVEEAFNLTAFEGLRFMSPVDDVEASKLMKTMGAAISLAAV
jgi:hypothetical protein